MLSRPGYHNQLVCAGLCEFVARKMLHAPGRKWHLKRRWTPGRVPRLDDSTRKPWGSPLNYLPRSEYGSYGLPEAMLSVQMRFAHQGQRSTNCLRPEGPSCPEFPCEISGF